MHDYFLLRWPKSILLSIFLLSLTAPFSQASNRVVAIHTAATGSDRIPGYQGSISKPYLTGITRGTDPGDPGYWGPHSEYEIYGTNNAMAILLSPEFFWDPLTPVRKQMRGLVDTVAYDCNHWYFHLMGIPILEKYAENSERVYVNRIFERLLNWLTRVFCDSGSKE